MALTIKAIDAAQPGEKARKLFDGGGLYIEIRPNGSKLWRLKYRVHGREKRLSFGVYPEVSLKEARIRCEDARRLLRDGVDPSANRQAIRKTEGQAGTFEAVAREWLSTWKANKAPSHHKVVLGRLVKDVFPRIGKMPIDRIEPVMILPILRAVEGRGAVESAHRVKSHLGMVFRYGVATGRCSRDPTGDLRGALAVVIASHHAAVTDPKAFGALLRSMDAYVGHALTGWALRLTPLLAVRPGELRHAEWQEVDLDGATWTISAAKMKMKRDHVVPLSRQAVAILREVHALSGGGLYVFPSVRTGARPMSENTVTAALRRLGYTTDEATAHGFRASFRTIGAEVLGFRYDLMEHQLAHEVKDPNGRAYNRAEFLPERREMMQRWADWCDEAKATQPSGGPASA